MGKKHKHEEHVNHERWVISFADMMTLLFALFVVLYALGQADLAKAKQLKDSIQFAFHIAGEGKTRDEGLFDKQSGGGEVAMPAPLLTAQDGPMMEFLREQLEQYEEVTGRSLEATPVDDSVGITAPLSDFFARNSATSVKRDIAAWMQKTIEASLTFSSDVRILVQAPDVAVGVYPNGTKATSVDLCLKRLGVFESIVRQYPTVREGMLEVAFRRLKPQPGRTMDNWEDAATVTILFSNSRPENR